MANLWNKIRCAVKGRDLRISTWNISAVNNNPFEYWITVKDNPAYDKLMLDVEEFLENPGDNDILVSSVFTDAMFDTLQEKMAEIGIDPDQKSRKLWEDDFRGRSIITGFMKDKTLGNKRLASMPDRFTNTINVEDSKEPVCRPTVINMYEGDLSSMALWLDEWMVSKNAYAVFADMPVLSTFIIGLSC